MRCQGNELRARNGLGTGSVLQLSLDFANLQNGDSATNAVERVVDAGHEQQGVERQHDGTVLEDGVNIGKVGRGIVAHHGGNPNLVHVQTQRAGQHVAGGAKV